MPSKVNPPLEIVVIVSLDNLSVEQTPKQKELITKLSWPTTTLSHLEQQWLGLMNDPNNFESNLPKVDFIVGNQRFVDVIPVAIENFETDSNLEKPKNVKLTFDFQAQLEVKSK